MNIYPMSKNITSGITPKESNKSGVKKLRNILISSAARKIPLLRSVTDAARRLDPSIHVLAGDFNKNALSRFFAHQFISLPRIEKSNLNAILSLCISSEIDAIIPTRDGELNFWATHAPLFQESGIDIVVSSTDAISISLDKLRFSEFGKTLGYPIISSWNKPQGNGPFVVKERFGSGSRSVGLNLNKAAAVAHAQTLACPIFQPQINGDEISIDAWIDRKHHLKGLVMRTRDLVENGESVVTTTLRDAALETVCGDLLESLSLRGPVVLQLIRDPEGLPHIIELNARFGGASTASIAAGLDIWFWTLLETTGASTDNSPFNRIPGEVRQIRAPSDQYYYDSHF